MVSVFFGWDSNVILNVDLYFNNVYEDVWFDDPFVREMILDVDKSVVLSRNCIESPVLGQIPPTYLSGGVKTCIMLYKLDDFLTDLIVCGENCEKWLSKIFKAKERVRVVMSGYDLTFKGYEIQGICENDKSIIRNSEDWVRKMCDLVEAEGSER